ncbi:nicotinic acid mononucleotide adenyltransferase [Sungkyunkwania multivorans]|uniref:Nicotinic acid mononucleotide adenyltransferase n=1 Tax=Sungkyunkwania multivorans TaxID=1173618 RepID=A0ABW3CZQ0_9FLAO
MKTLKLLFGSMLMATLLVSCVAEVIIEEPFIDEPITLAELLDSHELWYVNINQTTGNGEVPFLQKAFTVSFNFGTLFANNNLVGLGSQGNGYGIDVGYYDTRGMVLQVDHDIDGYWALEVSQLGFNRIRLYHRPTNTAYFLTGYQRGNFDYDFVFYDNIHYFLQEYVAWEKTYVSEEGALNDFDAENFLRFLAGGSDDTFESSEDQVGTPISQLYWDYIGYYSVFDVNGDPYLKTLTLDYDELGNDYFELIVIDDSTIELYHPNSGTTYEFTGRGYIQYLKGAAGKGQVEKKRKKIINKKMNIERKSAPKKMKIESKKTS